MEDTPKQNSQENVSAKTNRRRKRKAWRGPESPGPVSMRSSTGSGAMTPSSRTYGDDLSEAASVPGQQVSTQDSFPLSLRPQSRSHVKQESSPSRRQDGYNPVAVHRSAGTTLRPPTRRSLFGRESSQAAAERRYRDPADLRQPYSAARARMADQTSTDDDFRAFQQPPQREVAAGRDGANVNTERFEMSSQDSQFVPRAGPGRSSFKSAMSPVGSVDRRVTIHPTATRKPSEAGIADLVSTVPDAAKRPRSSLADTALSGQASRRQSARGEVVIREPPPVWHPRAMSFDADRRKSLQVQEAISQLPIPSATVHKSPLVSPLGALRSAIVRPGDRRYGTRGVSSSPHHGNEDRSQKWRRLKNVGVRVLDHRLGRNAKVSLVAGFILSIIVIYVVLKAVASPPNRILVCSTDDCLDHAGRILRSLNPSVDPCAHFHEYVCGPKEILHREVIDDLQYAMFVVASASRAVTSSPPANGSLPAAYKAMAALSTCLDVSSAQSAEPFVNFMKEHGMSWPAKRLRADLIKFVDVLDVLLDLTINWRVGLWFDVKRTYLTEDYGLVIIFGDPGPLPVLRMQQLSTLDDAAYADTVKSVSHFLTSGRTQLNEPSIQTLRKDENAIRSTILSAPVDEYDVLLPLHRVHHLFTEKVSLNDLLAVISKHLKSVSRMSLETKILIIRHYSLTQLLRLFETISPARLLDVIGWMFSYAYVWILNASFVSLDAAKAENTSNLMLCFLAVHESFGIVQASPLFHALFDAVNLKDEVFAVFNSTSKALTNLLQASEMISNLTKKEVALKIGDHIRVRLLPPQAFIATDILDALYGNFPDDGDNRTFFDIWIESREALMATLADPFHDSVLTARYRRMSGRGAYFYSLNLVWLGLSALLPPSYRKRGSALMTYSGLGYQLARQLVRAFDERGRKMDYSGLDISWWEQQGKCALDTAQTAERKKAVTDLFALDVALEALKTSVRDLSSLAIKRLEGFSPTQTFYISYCSHFCDDPAGPDQCDLAINSSDFAEAFGCRREAARTCLFA